MTCHSSMLVENSGSPACGRTWADIDHVALLHNVAAIRLAVGPKPEILAVVKANAYGHGALEVARTLAPHVSCFGVACIEEAAPLRSLGRDILILGPCLPWERAEAVRANDIVTVSGADEAAEFGQHGACRINFKIDTGMGRIGCAEDGAVDELQRILRMGLEVHSISSHLPASDEDVEFTSGQLARIADLRSRLSPLAPQAKWHVLNSAGIFAFSDHSMELVRAGISLYGAAYPPDHQNLLRPVLTWKARVLLVKDLPANWGVSYGRTYLTPHRQSVAIVSAGYADGFPRHASNHGAEVLCSGRRCPVLGRITMDQMVIDVTHIPPPAVGDEVVLIGTQANETILVRELAEKAHTIAWDIFTSLGDRVQRHHHRQKNQARMSR